VNKNTLVWMWFVGISWDYPLQTRTSGQPIKEAQGSNKRTKI
jgi:hypothetical protein